MTLAFFVFFRFRRTEKMDSVTKGLMGQSPRQNFWAKTAPVLENSCRVRSLLKPNVTDKPFCQTFFERSISDKQ